MELCSANRATWSPAIPFSKIQLVLAQQERYVDAIFSNVNSMHFFFSEIKGFFLRHRGLSESFRGTEHAT